MEMDDVIRRGGMMQITLGEGTECSGSGFFIDSSRIITSTSWMRQAVERRGSTELSLMKGVQTTAHLLSQSIHNTAVASLVGLHYMEDVHALLMELEKHSLDEWTVGCNNDTVIDDLFYLSCIAVFTIDSTATPSITLKQSINRTHLIVGGDIFVISTPFGSMYPKIFLNSVCKGCMSNIYGHNGQVFLIDAPCVQGCEGGMVLSGGSGTGYSTVGMVIAPLMDSRGIPVNSTLVCSLASIHKAIGLPGLPNGMLETPQLHGRSLVPDAISSLAIPVLFGGSIGTGLFITNRLILTCAHVVKETSSGSVLYRGDIISATVLYHTPCDVPDIAILSVDVSCRPSDILDLDRCLNVKCCVGEPVISMGFGYQDPFTTGDAHPTMSKGVIAKVVPNNSHPVMVHTTCCVHPGMSGGLLYSLTETTPLGLLTCVVRDHVSRFNHSRLSLVMPFCWIAPTIKEYIITRDPTVFGVLKNDAGSWTFTSKI